jgi:hypothetical protein
MSLAVYESVQNELCLFTVDNRGRCPRLSGSEASKGHGQQCTVSSASLARDGVSGTSLPTPGHRQEVACAPAVSFSSSSADQEPSVEEVCISTSKRGRQLQKPTSSVPADRRRKRMRASSITENVAVSTSTTGPNIRGNNSEACDPASSDDEYLPGDGNASDSDEASMDNGHTFRKSKLQDVFARFF